MKQVIACIALLFVSLFFSMSAFAAQPAIPLEKGIFWVYEGTIKRSGDGSEVTASKISWTTRIEALYRHPGYHVAVVSGFPDELAWYELGNQPRYSLLVQSGEQTYLIPAENRAAAEKLAVNFPASARERLTVDGLLLDLPLSVGKRFAVEDQERTDGMYCWIVEGETAAALHVSGYDSEKGARGYQLAYRTNSDLKMFEFVPGLGITRFVYDHHGQTASVDVRLVQFGRRK